MNRLKLPIERIVCEQRLRGDLGDIDSLAASLNRYGLIQPIIVNQDNRLIAGERRLRAAQSLGWSEIDVVYRETLSPDELHELELEENVRRKDMSWQERVTSIATIHALKTRTAALTATTWGTRETAELLGINGHSNVYYAVKIAALLKAGDKEIAACPQITDAIRLLIRRKEDEAAALLVGKIQSAVPTPTASKLLASLEDDSDDTPAPSSPDVVYLSHQLVKGDSCDILEKGEHFGHGLVSYIITDPPYAVDMSMLSQENTGILDIDRVEAEHDVLENLDLLARFIPIAYTTLRDPGWLVMWCDAWNWRMLADLCKKAGFRVQRWPLVWIKTHPCINQAANKNFTKTTEFALVACKGVATMVTASVPAHFACGNDDSRKTLGHPFVKPKELWHYIYKALCLQRLAILDPFAGVGSASLATIDYGCAPLAIECNDAHYNQLVLNVKNKYLAMNPNIKFE